MGLLRAITRPARLREKEAEQRRIQLAEEGGRVEQKTGVSAESQVEDAESVRAMLASKGWLVVQRRLVRRNSLIWKEFVNPMTQGERAEVLRMQAVKYSGIEDIIDEVLRQGEAIKRSDT